ncbi:MAG: ribosome maturation factor RimM [Saprospiraceae bacterium]|nr:ribosome maturation factor RimM [Saprospiraceae bacterium]
MEKCLIGKLGKPHGLQGEVRVILTDESFEEVLEHAPFVFIKGLPYQILSTRYAGGLLLKLDGVEDRNAAEMIKGAHLELPTTPELESAQAQNSIQAWIGFMIHDVTTDRTLGPIDEVIELPTQLTALIQVDNKEVLIPLHENLILDVDLEKRVMTMDLPVGLIDLYLQ